MSQAALIHRQILNSDIDIELFSKWAFDNRVEQYYFQSFTDMRLEPRWNPHFGLSQNMKADFFGRIMNAAKFCENNIKDRKVFDIILGTGPQSIYSLSDLPRAYLPGPLEGYEKSPNPISAEQETLIKTQLCGEEIGPMTFVRLMNHAFFCNIGSTHAELAANALKTCGYRLINIDGRTQLLDVLHGLATVAAVSRSRILADELRILVRRYMLDSHYSLSINEVIQICIVAAASRKDLNEWIDFVGDWLTELAFGALVGDDGPIFHSHLRCLFHAVPELWVTCGRADAALIAYNESALCL